jgi:uncharacterized protein (DUF433 family)
MLEHPRITLASEVLAGKPVIRGTRLSVEFVIGLMADGWSEADIPEDYPGIAHDDVIACLAYARDTLSLEKVPERGLICVFWPTRISRPQRSPPRGSPGHDIVWVRIAAPGMPDSDVLTWAARAANFIDLR